MSDDETDDGPGIVEKTVDAVAGSRRKRNRLRMTGSVVVVGIGLLLMAALAWVTGGVLAGAAFAVAVVVGAIVPLLAVMVLRDLLPNILATGFAVAAQLAFDVGALVRRSDGEYEWTVLRKDGVGYHARLNDGTRVPVDADKGDLFAFGYRSLAIVEERGEQVERHRVTDTPGDSDRPVGERAGVPVKPPRNENDGLLVSLSTIQRRIRGSASSELVRRGRDKALDEEGGQNQLSHLWTMAFSALLLVLGFVMTVGALSL